MEYVIAFKNTNQAIKAEHCLLEKGLSTGVMPLPPQIKAGCGICLRVGSNEIAIAISILAEAEIEGIALFSREDDAGRYTYTEVGTGAL